MNQETITITEYLTKKGIQFRESGKELIAHCLFNECDSKSRGNESHLYFNKETTQYECKKCGEKGNILTLAKHFCDNMDEIYLNPRKATKSTIKYPKFDTDLVEACHQALPITVRQYLNNRGVINEIIDEYKLGWGNFYGEDWVTIPIKDINGDFSFFKLRQDPNSGHEKKTYPKGIEAQIYDWETLQGGSDKILLCEGELDRLALLSIGVPAITSTHGAGTFKQEWVEEIGTKKQIYICYDNDDAGKKGAEKVAKMLENTDNELFIVTLPDEVGDGGDITDYLTKVNANPDDLFGKYAKAYPEKIDTSQFKPFSKHELLDILGITIKKDDENKLITFLCELSAYTDSSQLNISFNAPSSTGKSYIPTEIAQLFPEDDIVEVGYCSPTAFFHDVGEYNKEKEGYIVDLSRKILIFLDQPHTLLLQHLRPMLSHDKKEIRLKITDKSQKAGLKTKNIFLRGYPSVIFCTAGLKIDEQETTRFLLLSPETNDEKLREAIHQKIRKETDNKAFLIDLENQPERKLLKERIRAVKQAKIEDIKIGFPEEVDEAFFKTNRKLKPRNQRDIGRIISLTKAFALLNLWFRDRDGTTITANEDDIKQAFEVWDAISESQELNLPPFIFQIYQDLILPLWKSKNQAGLTRQEITKEHFRVYGRVLADWYLRQQIIPMLENSGLIIQEPDQMDKRKMLICPAIQDEQNNSESDGGVKKYIEEMFETDGEWKTIITD